MNLPSAWRYRLDDIKAWFDRIIYCHHNARVLADMEYRFGCVLSHCTRGMSKAYYPVDAMLAEIDQYISDRCEEAVDDEMEGFQTYQEQARAWGLACFGREVLDSKSGRNHRFAEEAIELTQSLGMTAADWLTLVDYVYGRPDGEPEQEVGGVMVTLALLCGANKINMIGSGNTELMRVWDKIPEIRAKQAAKPKFGPLPGPSRG
jgi:hypothetical protein